MTRIEQAKQSSVGIGLVALGLMGGWVGGVLSNTRVNTAAAKDYVNALDIEARAHYQAQLATVTAACEISEAKVQAQALRDTEIISAKLQETQEELSERIVGLREQLRAAGITERVERLRTK